jgi:hypothetical protein
VYGFVSDQSPMVKPKYIDRIHGNCSPVYTGVEYLSKNDMAVIYPSYKSEERLL